MSYTNSYERINWQNKPSVATPINATNLNKMDAAIKALDEAMGQISAASRVFSMNAESVASDKITAYIGDDSIGGAKDLIILNTLNKSGTTGSSWSLYLVSPVPGGTTKTLALKNADGSAAYADAVDANAIMFILVTSSSTANVVGVVNSSNIDFPLSIDKGGTGNSDGYVRTGQAEDTTIGTGATAEGANNTASGDYSHAEGRVTIASGSQSHAEGFGTRASKSCAHAEGANTVASGEHSHAGGLYTVAAYSDQTAIGKFNDNKSDTLFEVGNGTTTNARSNALEVKGNGDVIAGNDVINADGYSLRAAENAISNPKTVTGNPIMIEDALESNADGLVAQIVPIQSGSGDPSPENVRPISGRTSVNLGRSGKNLCGEIENGAINTSDGQNVPNATTYRTKDYIPVEYGTTYNINNLLAYSQATCVFFYDANKGYISNDTYMGTNASTGISVTVNVANAKFVRFHANQVIMTNTTPVQVEQGNAPTAYEAPHIITLTIALGTTVYGGSLDVKTGVLTITNVLQTFDGSDDESWGTLSGDNFYQFTMTISDAKDMLNLITNEFKRMDISYRGQQTGAIYYNDKILRIALLPDMNITTVAEWRAWLAQNPLQICYELATPTTLQLTGEELALLMGYNRITSDSGDITLTYKANAVQAKADEIQITTNVEMGTKASKAYTVNQFMLRSDGLYKVTANIASGATLTSSNTTKVTITEVLTALLNA